MALAHPGNRRAGYPEWVLSSMTQPSATSSQPPFHYPLALLCCRLDWPRSLSRNVKRDPPESGCHLTRWATKKLMPVGGCTTDRNVFTTAKVRCYSQLAARSNVRVGVANPDPQRTVGHTPINLITFISCEGGVFLVPTVLRGNSYRG